jgi:GNAT superfamily N-acetyltransferase
LLVADIHDIISFCLIAAMMMALIRIQPMQADDVSHVFAVQVACYQSSFHESISVIAERFAQSPQTAWLAWQDDQVVGYLVAYRSVFGKVSPLGAGFDVAPQPTCLYLHDLAIVPSAAGRGVAARLIGHARQWAQAEGLQGSALVSVQDSQAFWQKYGYQACGVEGLQQQHLATYGMDVCYMTQQWTNAVASAVIDRPDSMSKQA